MANKDSSKLPQLDPDADEPLFAAREVFHDLLLKEAARLSRGQPILAVHIKQACRNLLDVELRGDVQAIISRALRENKSIEWIAYFMVIALFGLGAVLIAFGLLSTGDIPSRIPTLIGGAISHVLLLPALRFAINARRHNLAIRLFGAALERAETPKTLTLVLEQITKYLFDHK